MGPLEACAAFVVLALWVCIFAGGILVDTEPYRNAISSSGAAQLKGDVSKSAQPSSNQAADVPAPAATSGVLPAESKLVSWAIVLVCFLPLNLVWVCASASALGAFGNRANLGTDDGRRRSRDDSNPYVSAVLRGVFAYLFMISGLLLLDDSPFSHPTPGQYVRLAGFLSLLCFVVSYQPRLFNQLILWAFRRIEVREGEGEEGEKRTETLHATKTTVDVTATHEVSPHPDVTSSQPH